MTELLKKLCSVPAVSGREDNLRAFIKAEVSPFCQITEDKTGNLICFKKGKKETPKKVMLDAHMDEVGIIATAFTADGFVKFSSVGGIDTAVMLCRDVTFQNGVKGVVGLKPVHLAGEEKKKYPKEENLYIDIGVSSKAEAENLISLGDTAVFDGEIAHYDNKIKARAIDDRAGVAILISLLKEESEYDFYALFSWGEEIGCRGAKTGSFSIKPDYALVLEATTAADIYGVAEHNKVCVLGKGPAISFMDRGTLYDRRLYDLALSSGIPCQTKAAVAGGNNASSIHLSGEGVPTLAISLPTRYIHSPSCVADIRDFNNQLDLTRYMLNLLASGKADD